MKKKQSVYVAFNIILLAVTVVVSGIILWQRQEVAKWVLGSQSELYETHRVGFIPYWSFSEMNSYPYTHLTEIIYFGVTVDEDGSFIRTEDGKADLGWYRLYSEKFNTLKGLANQNGTKVSVALKPKKTEYIGAIVRNPDAQKQLRREIKRLIILRDLDGINIDFEFAHGDDEELSDAYFYFIAELFTSLRQEFPDLVLSFDEFPNTIVHANEDPVQSALAASDYYLIMGYDFHAGRSGNSGPVAPLRGKDGEINSLAGTLDVAKQRYHMAEFILGIPLYGYQWQTETAERNSIVIPNTAEVVTYDQSKTFPSSEVQWDELAQSPWYHYEEEGNQYQVYFENSRSIREKIRLAEEYGLSGVGFWAIDMVADSPDVWTEIRN
jgi:spore germination protein YaaH